MRIRNSTGQSIRLVLTTEDGVAFFNSLLADGVGATFTRFNRIEVEAVEPEIELAVRTRTNANVPTSLSTGGNPREFTDGDGNIRAESLVLTNLLQQDVLFRVDDGPQDDILPDENRSVIGSQIDVGIEGQTLILSISTVAA